ncbi:MAG: pentapeptide repeat-containing protein [Woronichinia naegeliana WA131]|jgi:hypothetical protein|uniref:Pentapeptide repeat-containing protein n=1 Tax=Woronichinia naegeliana WA131 TaxID=2824559 RepID=A0A977PYU6_9CYAN|nr:MAG: pentapeptide repeat-containing protein [Woronichinia naegeliana WA131]
MSTEQFDNPTPSSSNDNDIYAKYYELLEKNNEQLAKKICEEARAALEKERLEANPSVLRRLWRWTGIGEKKGWDIIQLISTVSIPLLLWWGTQYFTDQNNKQQQELAKQNKIEEREIADRKQKDELLKTYINDMKASLLDKDYPLKDSKKNSESRSIARTITLTTLTQLNSEQDQQKAKEGKYNQRKGLIIQFLYESGLIKFDPKVASIISLNTADLAFANLENANLYNANLYNANLYNAYLYNAYLESAKLNRTNFKSANFKSANLKFAYLGGANLKSADLKSANLEGANLKSANLTSADLSFANLYNAKNLTNQQIKSACSWEKAIYTEPDQRNRSIAKDPEANQRKINEIKQDKASDSLTFPPDCSMWK